jgi:hypothetical protein
MVKRPSKHIKPCLVALSERRRLMSVGAIAVRVNEDEKLKKKHTEFIGGAIVDAALGISSKAVYSHEIIKRISEA